MLHMYTDGAVSNNGKEGAYGGWCFVCSNNGHLKCGYVEPATNQICELLGVINACKTAHSIITENNAFPVEEVTIHSDSAYIVNCYKQQWWKTWEVNGWKNSKKEPVANQELWEELIPFFQAPNFHFEKVKGHSGNEWNEVADTWAVAAKVNKFNVEGKYSTFTKQFSFNEEEENNG